MQTLEQAVRVAIERTFEFFAWLWHAIIGFEIPFIDVPTVLVGGMTFNVLVAFILLGLIGILFLGVRNRKLGWNTAAILGGLIIAGLIIVSHAEQLSHAKKLSGEWVKQEASGRGVEVVAFVEKAPKIFYLWVNIDGVPRAFWIPWSQELQKSLQGALAERAKRGGQGNIWLRFGRPGEDGPDERGRRAPRRVPSLEEERFYFHHEPWPAPEPKDDDFSAPPRP